MSLNYKILLDTRRAKANGSYPVKLRVYSSTGNKETSLGISIRQEDWDEVHQLVLPTDPNYKTNSYKLNSAKNNIERKVMLAEDEQEVMLPDQLITRVKKKSAPKAAVTFKEFADILITDMKKAGRIGNAMAYTDAVNSIVNYSENKRLSFEAMTYKFIAQYNTDMLAKGLKTNSIAAYMRSIRAIYNKAIKADVVDIRYYPFNKFAIETEETISRKLTIEEMKLIVNYPLKVSSPTWHYRNLFILSFCLIGINFADLLTLTDKNIVNDRIVYKRHKTGKIYNIAMPQIVTEIFAKYQCIEDGDNKFILPYLKSKDNSEQERKRIKSICKYCGKYLKKIATACGISKDISSYYARYSWANIAKSLGYSKDLIAEALGHEYGNRVTGIYLDNYDYEIIDKANNVIIKLIFDEQIGVV